MSLQPASAWYVSVRCYNIILIDSLQLLGPFYSYSRAVYAELIPSVRSDPTLHLDALTDCAVAGSRVVLLLPLLAN